MSMDTTPDEGARCETCGCAKYISDSLPKEPRYETHQVATIGNTLVDVCYGGCLHNGKPPNYHPDDRAAAPLDGYGYNDRDS